MLNRYNQDFIEIGIIWTYFDDFMLLQTMIDGFMRLSVHVDDILLRIVRNEGLGLKSTWRRTSTREAIQLRVVARNGQ